MTKYNVKIRPLSRCIIDSLEIGEISSDFEEALLNPSGAEVRRKSETELWDYKEIFDINNTFELAKLAKRVIGFHNYKGGVLIFGVRDADFRVKGIQNSLIPDITDLTNKLHKYIDCRSILFDARITLKSNFTRSIWLLFIKKRIDLPVCTKENGPAKNNKPIFYKGDYFIRIGSQIKSCKDPIDFQILYTGVSFTHLKAYTYTIDEPNFRVLAPHTYEFVGREEIIEKVIDYIVNSRYFLFSLDGPGGVGKTAIAIEIVKRLYDSCQYDFIISLSAKNKVWSSNTESRQSDFSGLISLLKEVAFVLDIPTDNRTQEEIQTAILEYFSVFKGILLIDNIEEITDEGVFEFIKLVPDPTKAIVTSRVSKDLGAMRFDIPRMSDGEAKLLLKKELKHRGYHNYVNELEQIESIVQISNYLPLAIKWAASLINKKNNTLDKIYETIRKMSIDRKEFLEYIFSTMYNSLSKDAKQIASLSAYLGLENWTDISCSILLEMDEGKVKTAINELEDKDIIIKPNNESTHGERSMLPITTQFLQNKWHQNRNLRNMVEERIEKLVPISGKEGNIFTWANEDKIKYILNYTSELEFNGDYKKANKLIKLAYQFDKGLVQDKLIFTKLRFREGKIIYLKGKNREAGIIKMRATLEKNPQKDQLVKEITFLAFAMLRHGSQKDEQEAWKILAESIHKIDRTPTFIEPEDIEKLFIKRKFKIIRILLKNVTDTEKAYLIYTLLEDRFKRNTYTNELGDHLCAFFKLASKYDDINKTDKINLVNLEKMYSKIKIKEDNIVVNN